MEAINVTQLTTTLSLAWALSMARVILSFALTIYFVVDIINFVIIILSLSHLLQCCQESNSGPYPDQRF